MKFSSKEMWKHLTTREGAVLQGPLSAWRPTYGSGNPRFMGGNPRQEGAGMKGKRPTSPEFLAPDLQGAMPCPAPWPKLWAVTPGSTGKGPRASCHPHTSKPTMSSSYAMNKGHETDCFLKVPSLMDHQQSAKITLLPTDWWAYSFSKKMLIYFLFLIRWYMNKHKMKQ